MEILHEFLWMCIFFICSIITHFFRKFLLKKYYIENEKINELEKNSKVYRYRKNINEHLLKTQTNVALTTKYIFIIFGVIVFIKFLIKVFTN